MSFGCQLGSLFSWCVSEPQAFSSLALQVMHPSRLAGFKAAREAFFWLDQP